MKRLAITNTSARLSDLDFLEYKTLLEMTFPQNAVAQLHSKHRLRSLWIRDDWLASIELLSLAHAIKVMKSVDSKWTQGHAKKILCGNDNEVIGSTFELVLGAMMVGGGLQISPSKKDNPGFDFTLTFVDGFKALISAKNHDVSVFESDFQNRSLHFDQLLKSRLQELTTNALVLIEFLSYPTSDHWMILEKWLFGLSLVPDISTTTNLAEDLNVCISKLGSPTDKPLAKSPISSQLMLRSAFNKNEQKNFVTKLEIASQNLRKNADSNALKIIIMRLNQTASISYLSEFAKRFVDQESEIDGIVLYQPAVIRRNAESVLSHHLSVFASARWDTLKHHMKFQPLFGIQLPSPSKLVLRINGVDGFDTTDGYLYQRANFYQDFELRETTYEMSNPAPGVRIEIAGPNGESLTGKLFPTHEFLKLL